MKTVHLDEQNNDLYQFSFGNTPCVVGENEKGFKFIFSNTDLDNFNGDVKLFFKSLENKINKIFWYWPSNSSQNLTIIPQKPTWKWYFMYQNMNSGTPLFKLN